MTGRRIPSGRDVHYFDDWRPGWRQAARKRIDKRIARREDRCFQKWLLREALEEAAA